MAWGKRKRKRPRGGGVGVRDANEASSGGDVSPTGDGGTTAAASASASASSDVISSEDDVRIDVVTLSGGQMLPEPKERSRRRRIRVVRPYPYTFATYAKQRWIDRTLLEVYVDEFGSYPESYYRSAIEGGRITVSGKKVDVDYRIRGGDELNHSVHRHEPAVAVADLDDDEEEESNEESSFSDDRNRRLVKVVHDDGDVIAVDKPATMPVHPCGGYNFNSLFHVLGRQDPKLVGSLRAVHRLDRLTSGLVLVAKGGDVAKRLGKCLSGRSCEKMYLARVRGKFPLNANSTLRFKDCSARGVPCSYGEMLPSAAAGGAVSSPSKAVAVDGEGSSSSPPPSSNAGTASGEDAGPGKKRKADDDVGDVGNGEGDVPALGFWITEHESGEAVDDEVSLRDVFSSSAATAAGDVKCTLSHLLRTKGDRQGTFPSAASPPPKGGTENSMATTGLDGRRNFWLNLACPCRISDPKKGVCEAGGHLVAAATAPPPTDASIPTSKPPNGNNKKNKNNNKGTARKNNGVKPAQTAFAVLGYDPFTDSTLVLARPATGRTHQIRLHLQFLGHPIANDPNYGGELFFGDPDGRRASEEARKRLDELDRDAAAEAGRSNCEGGRGGASAAVYAAPPENSTTTDVPATEAEVSAASAAVAPSGEESSTPLSELIERTCVWCARAAGGGGGRGNGEAKGDRTADEFLVRSPGIWLHALQYSVDGATYRTELPVWGRFEGSEETVEERIEHS